jgi:hypothetical protein
VCETTAPAPGTTTAAPVAPCIRDENILYTITPLDDDDNNNNNNNDADAFYRTRHLLATTPFAPQPSAQDAPRIDCASTGLAPLNVVKAHFIAQDMS